MKFVIGGIGDFLQVIESAKIEQEIDVFTHYKDAKKFWDRLNIKANIFPLEEAQTMLRGTPLERKFFPKFRKKIGIHPIGSHFSNNYWAAQKKPLKFIPQEVLKQIINDEHDYYIFCTESERNNYPDIVDYQNVKFISEPNIWDSFEFAKGCDMFIGVDSAFKTFTVMNKIPTLVLIGNYEDNFRDAMFITPYVDYMDTIFFDKIQDTVDEIKRWIICK